MAGLGFRSRRILYAAVTEYIATGEPVGSRKLARRYGLEVSPATIRNELADLEEAGYMMQPHTSAGRIPTDQGFRAFVDALVRVREVDPSDQSAIFGRLSQLRPGVHDIAREAGRILSERTGAAVVLHTSRPADQYVSQLRWLPLRPGQLLAVLVTHTGAVENRVLAVEHEPDPGELERVHNYLSTLMGELTLAELRAAVAHDAARERSALMTRAHHMVEATVSADPAERRVRIEGQQLLLDQPEFADVDKLRGVLSALGEKEHLLELLDRTMSSGGVQVLIGAETQLGDTQELSLIAATYGEPGAATGTLAVIAPTRTDYQKVVPLVGFAASVLSDVLAPTAGAPRNRDGGPSSRQ